MKNIICIDLTQFNNEKLIQVLNEVGKSHNFIFNIEGMLENKKDGYANMYIDIDSGVFVASTTKKEKEKIVFTENFSDLIKAIKPITFTQEPKQLNLDTILEKIGKYGLESLTSDERTYLDNGSTLNNNQNTQKNSSTEGSSAKEKFDDFD